MDDKLYELLLKLPKKNLINLMCNALDEMKIYNGRSINDCICTALGCEEMEKNGRLCWKIPNMKTIKEMTENSPPY
jgi:hypothetical protein